MHRFQWMTLNYWMALFLAALVIGLTAPPATAQPGHAPFVFGALEIDDFERTLAPAGIAGATIQNPGNSAAISHPAVRQNGNMPTPYVTGAPLFLESAHTAYAQFGGLLGTVNGATPAGAGNYNDLFPGGWAVSPGGVPNGGAPRNSPPALASYNGTKISLVTNTDANTEDDVAITSGNQAMRVSMWNVGQGDGNTSFDRPVMLTIKANDFWGVADSRFQTWETVRANPTDYSISVDVTVLADEVPDTFDMTPIGGNPVFPYYRMGFIANHGQNFDEAPNDVIQHPPALNFSNADADADELPDFSDPEYVDPSNPVEMPGSGVPGVLQRRYVFPAAQMTFPPVGALPAPAAGNELRHDAGTGGVVGGGGSDAYMLGFVFNASYTTTVPTTPDGIYDGQFGDPQSFVQTHASFIVDNIRFIDRFPITSIDFDGDGNGDADDWNILRTNLNGLVPPAKTFAEGDIGSAPGGEEAAISPGVVDFADFVRFEEIFDRHNGGGGAFQRMIAAVPEPTSLVLVLMGLAALACGRRRPTRHFAAALVAASMALWANSASAVLTDVQLFSFEDGSFPDEFQRWVAAQTAGVDNATLASSTIGVTSGTQSLAVTQTAATNSGTFISNAAVSIFGSESGLPPQFDAFNAALDVGANHYVLDLDVTIRDVDIPDNANYIALSVGLTGGSTTNDTVSNAFIAAAGDFNQSYSLSIPLAIGTLDLMDGFLTMPDQASAAGSYNLTLGLDSDWTGGTATFYVDDVRLRQVTQPPKLTLEVNRGTGEMIVRNVPGPDAGMGDVIFDYYEISSVVPEQTADFNDNGTVDAADYTVWRDNLGLMDTATQADGDANGDGDVTSADYNLWKGSFGRVSGANEDSLNPAGWNSLDEQNVDANGVAVVNNWAEGEPSVSSLSEVRLIGNSTWNHLEFLGLGNSFVPGAEENLVFQYREPGRPGFLVSGLVTYVGTAPGGGSIGGSAVPEPGTFVLALVAGLFVATRRRRT